VASLPVDGWLGSTRILITPEMAAEHRANLREARRCTPRGADPPGHGIARLQFSVEPQRRARPVDPCRQPDSEFGGSAGRGAAVRARRITANYEHKGHLFVDLDALIFAGEGSAVRPIATSRTSRSIAHAKSRRA